MAKNHTTNNTYKSHKESQLELFALAFEYDKTLPEIKRDMRMRVNSNTDTKH